MYLTCSHHDGTCHYEIKILTDAGKEYLRNWEDSYNDRRTERAVHKQIFDRYSRIPRYAEKVWGAKSREYEPMTRETILRKLGNEAKSFYS
jgi:hypothetical protein